ncbi:unnamed protein product [Scytosiphon promiscuus]
MRVVRSPPVATVLPLPRAATSWRRRPREMPFLGMCNFRRDISSLLTTLLTMALLCGGHASAAAAESAETTAPTLDEAELWSAPEHGQSPGPGMTQVGLSATNATTTHGRRELHSLHRTDRGHTKCIRNSWWDTVVDPANYKFGCREIQGMFDGGMSLVGEGRVRDVYVATVDGQKVVVKTLRQVEGLKRQKSHLSMHRREVLVLDALRGHRNVVAMLGLCGTTIVTEYFDNNFLQAIFRAEKEMPLDRLLSLALDSAKGLQALHEIVGGIHFDMKPQQMLIDDTGRAMVNDFNSAHIMDEHPWIEGAFCPVKCGKSARLVPWRSPENNAGKALTEKADIYSMAMVFYSLVAGSLPYGDQEEFKMAYQNGLKPKIDPSWHTGFMKVVRDMWHDDPKQRPSARELIVRLQAIQDDVAMRNGAFY